MSVTGRKADEGRSDSSKLRKQFGRTKVREMFEFRGEHTVVVKLGALEEVLGYCRSVLGYEFLLDVSSVDNMGDDPRFEIVYELATTDDRKHLRVTYTHNRWECPNTGIPAQTSELCSPDP